MGKYGSWTYEFNANKVTAKHTDGRVFTGEVQPGQIVWKGEGKLPPAGTTKYILGAYLGGQTIRKPKK